MADNSTVLLHIKGNGFINEDKAGIDKKAVPEPSTQAIILDVTWRIITSGT